MRGALRRDSTAELATLLTTWEGFREREVDLGGFPGVPSRDSGGFPGIGTAKVRLVWHRLRRITMNDGKRKPGRPRKWSSDAERMRATRAAKREKQLIEDERRVALRQQRERKTRERYATAPTAEPIVDPLSPEILGDPAESNSACEAEVDKLRAEVRRLEDEYDDVVYDRWIFEMQFQMAVHRLRHHDPDGLAWLDDQLRRWARRREGELEDRRLARRSWGSRCL